jgi:hypothetical protein
MVAGFLTTGGVLWIWVRRRRRSPILSDWQFLFQDEQFYWFNEVVLNQVAWSGTKCWHCEDLMAIGDEHALNAAIPRRFCRDTQVWESLLALLRSKIECTYVPKPADYSGGGDYRQHSFSASWSRDVTESPVIASATGPTTYADGLGIVAVEGSLSALVWISIGLAGAVGLAFSFETKAWQAFFGGAAFVFALLLWKGVSFHSERRKSQRETSTKHPTTFVVRTMGVEAYGNRGRSLYRWEALRRLQVAEESTPADILGLYLKGLDVVIVLARRLFSDSEWQSILDQVATLPIHRKN